MRNASLLTLLVLAVALTGCGNDSGGSSIVGTYSLDASAFLAQMQQMMEKEMGEMLAAMPEEQVEKMKAEMLEESRGTKVDMEIKADNTWTGTAITKGKTEVTSGTWSRDGDTIAFTSTHEDGKKKDKPDVMTGTIEGDSIRVRPDEDMPFDMVLKRK